MRGFFWSSEHENKFHLIAWSKLCLPKSQGGLVVHNLRVHIDAVLGKWWWRCATHSSHLWREVFNHKYCHSFDRWIPVYRNNGLISGFWKSVLKCHEQFSRYIRFHTREGTRVSFWNDTWVGC
ncbi:hypothetical protein AMTRI_Chr10g227010 [Amborella trichopoda]